MKYDKERLVTKFKVFSITEPIAITYLIMDFMILKKTKTIRTNRDILSWIME